MTSPRTSPQLSVAVTGPTGTFGFGLLPLLEQEPRVGPVVGIARSSFDPAREGWTKMTYRQGDVRDQQTLASAFTGADVVVHLAFLIVGGNRETTRAVNIQGTLNAFRAAGEAGVTRFVYASSVAAYGFHPENPIGMTEQWPTRPAATLFYAQEKAELEALLAEESAAFPDMALYLIRPSVVVGPHVLGGKVHLPGPLGPLGERLRLRRLPVPLPAVVPKLLLQFVHEDDVGQALLKCVLGDGPAGAYNIAGDGVVSLDEAAREIGVLPVAVPAGPVLRASRWLSTLPLPTAAGWIEALSHPAIMDTSKAKEQLGWTPAYTGIQALRATVKPDL